MTLFAITVGPWYLRQLTVFGTLSPSTASGKVLFAIEIPANFERAVRRGDRPALLVAAFGYLALTSIRHIPIYAFVAIPSQTQLQEDLPEDVQMQFDYDSGKAAEFRAKTDDFNAILASLRLAERRVHEIVARFGVDHYIAAMAEMLHDLNDLLARHARNEDTTDR